MAEPRRSSGDETDALASLASSSAWSGLDGVVAESLSVFFGIAQEPLTRPLSGAPFAAEIALHEALLELEMAVTIAASQATIDALAVHVLGETDPEGGRALVLEAANVVMGSLKSSFLPVGFSLTGGLPVEVPYDESSAATEAAAVHRRIAFRSEAGMLELLVRVRATRNVTLPTSELREGMVVGEDVHDDGGHLLLRAGTRLTESTTARLVRFAPGARVVVSNASPRRAA